MGHLGPMLRYWVPSACSVSGSLGGDRGSRLNLFISGTETSIMMIEGEADFLTEEQMTAAIDLGMSVVRHLCRGLKAFAARSGPSLLPGAEGMAAGDRVCRRLTAARGPSIMKSASATAYPRDTHADSSCPVMPPPCVL